MLVGFKNGRQIETPNLNPAFKGLPGFR